MEIPCACVVGLFMTPNGDAKHVMLLPSSNEAIAFLKGMHCHALTHDLNGTAQRVAAQMLASTGSNIKACNWTSKVEGECGKHPVHGEASPSGTPGVKAYKNT
eukprot:1160449-Pelagomonas_calceolata.AAC.1